MTAPAATALGESTGRAGRHRSEAVDRAILRAATELLHEHGYEGLTMLGVIERAGVSSASLYRRWHTKQALVVAALESLSIDAFACDTGTLAGDLTAFAQRSARFFHEHGQLIGRLSSELGADEQVAGALRDRLVAPRVAELDQILRRAEDRGELAGRRPPAEDVLSLLSGPLHHRALVLHQPLSRAFVAATVHQTLGLLREGTD